MISAVRKAMQLTRSQCRTSLHYCFACSDAFEPSDGEKCQTCHWLKCPHCGACYCRLDQKSRAEVDDFYASHCAGEGCPYGKEPSPWVPPPAMPSPKKIESEVGVPVPPPASPKEKLESIARESKRVMQKGEDKIDPYLNDHSYRHVERVQKILDETEENLEQSSFTKKTLGRIPSEDDLLGARAAITAHDVGYVKDKRHHADVSADFVKTNDSLQLENGERDEVASLCLLHNRESTRRVFGTDDIAELTRSGMISRELGYKASLVRFADALDAGEKRVEQNSQGVPRSRVIRQIEKLPRWERDAYMSHWEGHRGFGQPSLMNEGGDLTLELSFRSRALKSHGSEAAFMVRDLLRDTNSTLIGPSLRVRLKCDDKEALKQWLSANRMVFSRELRRVKAVAIGDEGR